MSEIVKNVQKDQKLPKIPRKNQNVPYIHKKNYQKRPTSYQKLPKNAMKTNKKKFEKIDIFWSPQKTTAKRRSTQLALRRWVCWLNYYFHRPIFHHIV